MASKTESSFEHQSQFPWSPCTAPCISSESKIRVHTVCSHTYIRALPLPPRYRSVWSDPSHSHLVTPECHRPAWMTIRCASSVRWSQPTCKGIDLNRLDNDSMFRLLQDRFIQIRSNTTHYSNLLKMSRCVQQKRSTNLETAAAVGHAFRFMRVQLIESFRRCAYSQRHGTTW